jgi:hypothetical protein
VVVAALAALVVVIGIIVGVAATSSVGCASCHESQTTSLASSAHAGEACSTCHAAPPQQFAARLDVIVRMLPSSIGGVDLDGPGRPMGSRSCITCHDDVLSGDVVTKNGIRINHQACASETSCRVCHSASSHGTSTRFVRAPVMAECTACHLEDGASVECKTCHEGEMTPDLIRDSGSASIHGADWKDAHGVGDQRTCAVCHAPDDCARCHGSGVPHPADFGATHGTYALESGQDLCLTCHETASFCEGCHVTGMPHPEGFLQNHSGVATSTEDPACTPCHPLVDCKSCHTFHVHPGGPQPTTGPNGAG